MAENEIKEPPPRSRKPVSTRNDTLVLDGERGFFMALLLRKFFLVPNNLKQPKHVNPGQGGAVTQLQAISKQITEKVRSKRPGEHKYILMDILSQCHGTFGQ